MPQDGRMRVPRLWLAVVSGAVGVLVGTLTGVGPAAAAGSATLRLNPDHGRPTAPFAVEYQFSLPTGAVICPTVEFTWDSQPLGTARAVHPTAKQLTVCVAVLSTAPPADGSDPGRHRVGVQPVAGHPAQAATYTVQPGATATPSRPGPTSTPTRTTQPTTVGTDGPIAGGANTSPASVAPLDTNGASVLGEAPASKTSGGGLTSFILIVGGLLTLGGVVIFGLLIYWTRRGGGGGVEPDTEVFGE
jgi:hypothetical protein